MTGRYPQQANKMSVGAAVLGVLALLLLASVVLGVPIPGIGSADSVTDTFGRAVDLALSPIDPVLNAMGQGTAAMGRAIGQASDVTGRVIGQATDIAGRSISTAVSTVMEIPSILQESLNNMLSAAESAIMTIGTDIDQALKDWNSSIGAGSGEDGSGSDGTSDGTTDGDTTQ